MGDLVFEGADPNWATTTNPAPVPANAQRICDTLINYVEKDLDIYSWAWEDLLKKDSSREC